jgi:hypothetical protein
MRVIGVFWLAVLLSLLSPLAYAADAHTVPTNNEAVLAKIGVTATLAATPGRMIDAWASLSEATDMMRRELPDGVTDAQMDALAALLDVEDGTYRVQLRTFELLQEIGLRAQRVIPALSRSYDKTWCAGRVMESHDFFNNILLQNRLSAMRDLFKSISGYYPKPIDCLPNSPYFKQLFFDCYYHLDGSAKANTGCRFIAFYNNRTQRDTDQLVLETVQKIKSAEDSYERMKYVELLFPMLGLPGAISANGISDVQLDDVASLLSERDSTIAFKLRVFQLLEPFGPRAWRTVSALRSSLSEDVCKRSNPSNHGKTSSFESGVNAIPDAKNASATDGISAFDGEQNQYAAVMRDIIVEITHESPKIDGCQ